MNFIISDYVTECMTSLMASAVPPASHHPATHSSMISPTPATASLTKPYTTQTHTTTPPHQPAPHRPPPQPPPHHHSPQGQNPQQSSPVTRWWSHLSSTSRQCWRGSLSGRHCCHHWRQSTRYGGGLIFVVVHLIVWIWWQFICVFIIMIHYVLR